MAFKDQTIKFVIKKNGLVTQDVDGVQGPGCTALTKQVEDALGKVTKREMKEEAKEIKQAEKVKVGF